MESLVIDPFDSNHWLYGTGATIYGGHDLLKWDSAHNVTLKSLADGIEETSVQGLISPPTGPSLISALGDIQGKNALLCNRRLMKLIFMFDRICPQQPDYSSNKFFHQPNLVNGCRCRLCR